MRIACLQFGPQVGDVNNNISRADEILGRVDPEALDLLVLPELAFSGYNFKSLGEISQFLEPAGSGISSLWSRTTALKYDCTVIAGYPEKVDPAVKWPTNPEYYNAAIVVNGEGETVANYRKTHLYYTDETWALEGPTGFFSERLEGLGCTALGICMDLNPYKFEAPWEQFEFAHHVLDCGARLVVISMAWITNDDPRQFSRMPQEPDMDTLLYWVSRFEPVIREELDEEIVVVFANRTGFEREVTYAGTSAVIGIQSGEVRVYGILGRGDKELLVVDTDAAPYAKLVYRPEENGFEVDSGKPDASEFRHNDCENHSAERTEGGKNFESSSRNTQSSQGEIDAVKENEGSDGYRITDLSVQSRLDMSTRHVVEGPHIQTRTVPSPATDSARPMLMIATNHSNGNRYLDGPSPTSLCATNAKSRPSHILGGEASFHGSNVKAGIPPLAAPESQLSEAYCASSRPYSSPTQRRPVTASDLRREPPDDSEDLTKSDGPALVNQENRYSIGSDIAAWNNDPGRPTSIFNQTFEQFTPPSISCWRTHPDVTEKASSANHTTDASKQGSFLVRQPPFHSHHGYQYRDHQRSTSATTSSSDMGIVCRRLEDMVMLTNASQERLSSYNNNRDRSSSTSGYQASRSRSHSRTATPISHDQFSDLHTTTASIPLAFGRHPTNSTDLRHSNSTRRQRQPNPGPHDPPIFLPAFKGRVSQGSSSKRRIRDQTSSGSTLMHRGTRSSKPAKLGDRAISRGRQREIRLATDPTVDTSGGHERPKSANTTRDSLPKPADLSQFTRIEEYVAPKCSVHGARSRSRIWRRDQHGTSWSGAPAPARARRRSTQNTPRPASLKDVPKVVARSPKPRVMSKSKPKNLYGPNTPISTPLGSRPQNTVHRTPGIVDTVVSFKSSHRKLSQGLKTPKAMKLVSESKIEPLELMKRLKCVERSLGKSFEKSIDRPRSAIW